MPDSASIRYLDGISEVLDEIRREEWGQIEMVSSLIFESLTSGRRAFSACMNHLTPLANSYGTSGNPGIFQPMEHLVSELAFKSSNPSSFQGDVVLLSDQYSSSPPLEEFAFQARRSGATTVFVGPAESNYIPSVQPNKTLNEICDLIIDTHTPEGDALLKFEGLEVSACATSGVTGVAIFYALNLEVAEKLSNALVGGEVRSKTRNSRKKKA